MTNENLLDVILDSWDRNNTILVNLLRALPEDTLKLRAHPNSPTVAQLFTHIHYCRMVFIEENAPDIPVDVPEKEWREDERDPARIEASLNESCVAVRETVRSRIENNIEMKMMYDHPLLFLQHMIWHEGYHHGQIKLALKAAGRAFDDEEIGAVTWDVWMDKS